MAESDDVCSLTVKPDGAVVLRHAGKEYKAQIREDRRSKKIVERLDRLVKEYALNCQLDDLTLLGETLFDILFAERAEQVFVDDSGKRTHAKLDDTLGQVFLRLYNEHRSSGRSSRLQLSLAFEQGADRWANLPWEFLYALQGEKDGFFIAGQSSLSLTRIISPPSERARPHNPPHILVVLAQPRDLMFHMEKKELLDNLVAPLRRQLQLPDKADQSGNQGQAENPEVLFEPTWNALTARLGDLAKPAPDVIHFVCHGRFSDGKSEIALHRTEQDMNSDLGKDYQRKPRDYDWHRVEALKENLKNPPWLFFLQTCDSGRSEGDYGASRSAAQQVAQAGVPFVVAMQYRITAGDADQFRNTFYENLGKGMCVDDAVMLGREVLGTLESPFYGHPRFATPVIYLRSKHRMLLPSQKDDTSIAATSSQMVRPAEAIKSWQCPSNCGVMIFSKQKRCPCRKYDLVYCAAGHANVAGVAECETYECDQPLVGSPAVTAPPPAAGAPQAAPPDSRATPAAA